MTPARLDVAVGSPGDRSAVAIEIDGQFSAAAGETAVIPGEESPVVPKTGVETAGGVALENAAVEGQATSVGQPDAAVGLQDALIDGGETGPSDVVAVGVGSGQRQLIGTIFDDFAHRGSIGDGAGDRHIRRVGVDLQFSAVDDVCGEHRGVGLIAQHERSAR